MNRHVPSNAWLGGQSTLNDQLHALIADVSFDALDRCSGNHASDVIVAWLGAM